MVAYSFQQQFRAPILARAKRQTIRADRKRHAWPGEQIQLYTAMRTRHCALIARAACEAVEPVRLHLGENRVEVPSASITAADDLDRFARADGFADWPGLVAFWREHHPEVSAFSGVLIRWELLPVATLGAGAR